MSILTGPCVVHLIFKATRGVRGWVKRWVLRCYTTDFFYFSRVYKHAFPREGERQKAICILISEFLFVCYGKASLFFFVREKSGDRRKTFCASDLGFIKVTLRYLDPFVEFFRFRLNVPNLRILSNLAIILVQKLNHSKTQRRATSRSTAK